MQTQPVWNTSSHYKNLQLEESQSQYLSYVGVDNPDKIRIAYSKLMDQKSENMGGKMNWLVDWFPEPMPIENAAGTNIYYGLEYLVNPSQTYDGGQWPPVDQGAPEPLDILMFTDSYGYCKEIVDQAPPGRIGVLNIQSKAPSTYDEKSVKQLIKAHQWSLLVFAVGIDPSAESTAKSVHETQDAILKLYLYILKAIGDTEGQVKKVAIITADTFAEEAEIHEEMGLSCITNGTLFGMTNTARAEIPHCPFHYIDTEWALLSENSKYLSAEIFRDYGFGHNSVRILNKGRYVLRAVDGSKYENKELFEIPDDGVLCITGGNGALGLVMGIWILTRCEIEGKKKNDLTIEFCSRSGKINDQNMPNWKICEEKAAKLGITVKQVLSDCSKQESAVQYIKEKNGKLKGLIHSAGVLQDSMLFNMTWEKFDKCFEGKSRAAIFLHEALMEHENPDLKFFWVFSSGAVYGNMGQLNYSASNSELDALVRHRRALGLPAMAPQWGAWGEVGMAKNLDDASRRRMASSPFPYFTNAEGLQGMEQLIKTGCPYGQIMKTNPPVVFGMIMADDVAAQCYIRNFYSEIAPPPPGDVNKNPYTVYSYEMRKTHTKLKNGLVMKAYCPKIAKECEIDDI